MYWKAGEYDDDEGTHWIRYEYFYFPKDLNQAAIKYAEVTSEEDFIEFYNHQRKQDGID